jgi:hypothetical protein
MSLFSSKCPQLSLPFQRWWFHTTQLSEWHLSMKLLFPQSLFAYIQSRQPGRDLCWRRNCFVSISCYSESFGDTCPPKFTCIMVDLWVILTSLTQTSEHCKLLGIIYSCDEPTTVLIGSWIFFDVSGSEFWHAVEFDDISFRLELEHDKSLLISEMLRSKVEESQKNL